MARTEEIASFIKEAHPLTIKYMDAELMNYLKRIDSLNKMQDQMNQIRLLEQTKIKESTNEF
jgi:hypothetical protein|tara:strand:- start:1861 stop:2046 length:186 start_codon:yes stop_codon:yes gene_type:complete